MSALIIRALTADNYSSAAPPGLRNVVMAANTLLAQLASPIDQLDSLRIPSTADRITPDSSPRSAPRCHSLRAHPLQCLVLCLTVVPWWIKMQ